jgi:hypothetical protein
MRTLTLVSTVGFAIFAIERRLASMRRMSRLHRTRHLSIRQQTSVINAIRAHLAELGIVAPGGPNGVDQLLGDVADSSDKRLPVGAFGLPSQCAITLIVVSGKRRVTNNLCWRARQG